MNFFRVAAVALVATLRLSAGEQGIAPYHVGLAVNIKGDDSLKARVYSLVSRELRKLGDVEISDDTPVHTLHILGFTSESVSGVKTGFILSVSITRLFPLSAEAGEKAWEQMYGDNPEQILNTFLYTGSAENLEDTCKEIVADFDSGKMDYTRKLVSSIATEMTKKAAKTRETP